MKYQIALDKVSEVSPLLIGEAQQELKVKSEEFVDSILSVHQYEFGVLGL